MNKTVKNKKATTGKKGTKAKRSSGKKANLVSMNDVSQAIRQLAEINRRKDVQGKEPKEVGTILSWPGNPTRTRSTTPEFICRAKRRRIMVEPGNYSNDIRWNALELFIRKQDGKQPILLMQEKYAPLARELARRNGWDIELFAQPTTVWTEEGEQLVWQRMLTECTHLVVVPTHEGDEKKILELRDQKFKTTPAKVFR